MRNRSIAIGAMSLCRLAVTLAAVHVLAGCGSNSHPSSQVIAKVNGHEITVSQLNETLQARPPESITPEATRQAVASLIDEELLVQDALKSKIDRDPATVRALEHARRQVLTRAFAERMLFSKSPISLAEEEEYFRQHPALFEDRKFYHLTIFSIRSADMNDVLSHDLDNTHSPEDVRGTLEKHEIKFETQQLSAPAEDLPMDKISQFSKAVAGDLLTAQQPDGRSLLISVVDVEPRPLTFERAKPIIEQYLVTTRNSRAIEEHLKQEKAVANISYVGRFAVSDAPAASAAAAPVGELSGGHEYARNGIAGAN